MMILPIAILAILAVVAVYGLSVVSYMADENN